MIGTCMDLESIATGKVSRMLSIQGFLKLLRYTVIWPYYFRIHFRNKIERELFITKQDVCIALSDVKLNLILIPTSSLSNAQGFLYHLTNPTLQIHSYDDIV